MPPAKNIPRGIRNNNPLNIRIGNVWLGEREHPTDLWFEEFVTMAYGLRAAFVILRRYIRHYHIDTVAGIVHRWSPDGGEKEKYYIDTVCQRTQLTPDQPIKYEDRETMVNLVAAMAFVECGQNIAREQIERGYTIA